VPYFKNITLLFRKRQRSRFCTHSAPTLLLHSALRSSLRALTKEVPLFHNSMSAILRGSEQERADAVRSATVLAAELRDIQRVLRKDTRVDPSSGYHLVIPTHLRHSLSASDSSPSSASTSASSSASSSADSSTALPSSGGRGDVATTIEATSAGHATAQMYSLLSERASALSSLEQFQLLDHALLQDAGWLSLALCPLAWSIVLSGVLGSLVVGVVVLLFCLFFET
jgi:hypothetical protein